ncbi:MAG: type II toxin-antitoxin system HipA family toxin, partial [Vicinamibacterales bacterium]
GVSLAPFYDVLSIVAYPDLSPNLAMKIAKRATIEQIGPMTSTAFAEDIGLAASFVRRRVRELSDAVTAQVLPISASTPLAALDASVLKEYAALIASRAARLAKTITA